MSGPVRLSAVIMAHPARASLVAELAGRLDVEVVWDSGNNNRWDTGRRAWLAADSAATHHLVIQDDAIVCADLLAGLTRAVGEVPDEAIVCPYVGTRRPMAEKVERAVARARTEAAAWIVMRGLNWGVAIVAPTGTIRDMVRWCDRQPYPNYDRRVGRYYLEVLGWPTWCTYPALVDHRPVPSLCGHGLGRQAHQFLGEDRSALDVDWTAGRVVMSEPGPPTRRLSLTERKRMAAARAAAGSPQPRRTVVYRAVSNGRVLRVVEGSVRELRLQQMPQRWTRDEVISPPLVVAQPAEPAGVGKED